MSKKSINKKILIINMGLLVVLVFIFIAYNYAINSYNTNSDGNSQINSEFDETVSILENKSKEMSENDFGADMPRLGFASEKNIIVYDDYGIYIFNIISSKLTGYFDFEENGLGGMQGSNSTFVYVSSDGSNIYIDSTKKKKFIYEVGKGSYKTADFDIGKLDLWKQELSNEPIETDIYFSIGEVYKGKNGQNMFLAIRKNLQPNYASLIYVHSYGQTENIYQLFK